MLTDRFSYLLVIWLNLHQIKLQIFKSSEFATFSIKRSRKTSVVTSTEPLLTQKPALGGLDLGFQKPSPGLGGLYTNPWALLAGQEPVTCITTCAHHRSSYQPPLMVSVETEKL